MKSRSGAESPFRCCFDIPGADQREALEGRKLCCFSPLRKVLILVLVWLAGMGQSTDPRPTGGASCNRSCRVFGEEALKEFALGALHIQGRFGIGLGLDQAIQFRQRDVRPQITLAAR